MGLNYIIFLTTSKAVDIMRKCNDQTALGLCVMIICEIQNKHKSYELFESIIFIKSNNLLITLSKYMRKQSKGGGPCL